MKLAFPHIACARLLAAASILFLVAGCSFSSSGTASAGGDDGEDLDVDAVLAAISDYETSGAFELISGEQYPSAVASGADIRLWVTNAAAELYAEIDPDVFGSNVSLPEGTIIVREVLNEAGAIKSLTLMGKGPPGYNPDLGDWWFGVARPDGTIDVEDGEPLIGRLEDCYGCHTPRADDDYLFGVPAAAKGPADRPSDPPPDDSGPVCGDFICDRPAGEDCRNCASDCFCAPDDDDDDGDDGDDGDDDDDGDDGDDGRDTTPPTFEGVQEVVEVSDRTCSVHFEPATDDVTPSDEILYDVFAGPRDDVDLSSPVATLDRSQLSDEGGELVGEVSLSPGERYDLIVRARDAAGNSDDNTEEDDCDLR